MAGEEQLSKLISGASLVASGVGAAYKIYDSIRKKRQANKIGRETKRPIYNRPEEIDDAYNLALSEVGNTEMRDFGANELQKNAMMGIDAILKGGGRLDFGVVNNQFGKGFNYLADTLRRDRAAQIANVNNTAYNRAKAKDAEFQYNKAGPYADAKQLQAQLNQQAEQSKNEAFSLAAGGIANYGIANTKPGQYGTGSQPVDDMGNPVGTSYGFTGSTGSSTPPFRPVTFGAKGNTLDASTDLPADNYYLDENGNEVSGFDIFGDRLFRK